MKDETRMNPGRLTVGIGTRKGAGDQAMKAMERRFGVRLLTSAATRPAVTTGVVTTRAGGWWRGALVVLAVVVMCLPLRAAEPTIETLPPVVVKTVPEAGDLAVAPGVVEVRVTFSKKMLDRSWSWTSVWQGSEPEMIGQPRFDADGRTCVLKVKLAAGRAYGWWLNSEKFKNFKDAGGRSAVPYLLTFQTREK